MFDALSRPQTVLLVGGTSDIARAVARHYADAAPRVIVAARRSERRDAAMAELEKAGARPEALDFDAEDLDTHGQVVERAFAGGDVDLVVIATGVLGDQETLWHSPEATVRAFTVNTTSTVGMGARVAERLQAQGHGVIVALSSVAGERVRRSNFVYGASKAGMDGYFTGLGEALRDTGVRVVVVRPGFVRTSMTQGLPEAPLTVDADTVAAAIARAVSSGTDLVWVPAPMRAVMSALRHVPRPVFRRLPL